MVRFQGMTGVFNYIIERQLPVLSVGQLKYLWDNFWVSGSEIGLESLSGMVWSIVNFYFYSYFII